ncbi:B12-binding domain-containing radical SAM protein [Candidatus Woesearchaeota archaeon]|nr:B12-binding domain-containing radical SAM protein [Candidatus Woesearchaeota archaeon]MBL7057366.1 B12-binding domain-containing radical SAM protein [Candidatus Woesearchaeota archaeon]
MTDVILFKPLYTYYAEEYMPYSLLFVASYLVKEGFSVRIIDESLEPNWKEVVLKELKKKPILFGVTSMTGQQIKNGLKFSEFVKKHSEIPVIWGGPHVVILPEQTLENPLVDFVVRSEGELTILELVKALKQENSFENILGLGYKKNKKLFLNKDRPPINLDDIPSIPFHLVDIEKYIDSNLGGKRTFRMPTTRGCPHKCSFCVHTLSKTPWRSMSVEKIIRDLQEIIREYNIDSLYWADDNFFVSKKRVERIAKSLIKEEIYITWSANCRVDYLDTYDDSFLDLLKQSGCYDLSLGIESGSNKILKKIKKGITREQILRIKNKLSDKKIRQTYLFMIGFPDETRNDVMLTVSMIKKLLKKNKYFFMAFSPTPYTPYPGTELYDLAVKKGFNPPNSLEGWINMDWQDIKLPWLSKSERRFVDTVMSNLRALAIENSLVRNYFLFKLFLIERFDILIPNFERSIYRFFKKFL